MKNPKKPGKPYNPTPKPTAKPPAVAGGVGSLPSEQWFSESTVFAVASQAADSPSASASDTGGPPDPDPCKGKIFKHSDPLPTELPIHHAQTPEEMGGKPGAPGCSDWLNKPYPPTIDTMCDGKAKVWRAFVKDCSFQLQVYIGKAKHRIFVEKIQEETDCAKLLLMLNDLKTLAADAGDNPAHADLRQPFDYIKKHERLHQKLLRESARSRYTNLVAAIEAITASCSLSQDDAERAMGPAIQDAKDEFKKGIDADREDNKNHKPRQRFIDTSNDITKAWIVAVEQRRKALNCP